MYTYLIGIKLETKKIEKEYYSIKNSIIFFEKKNRSAISKDRAAD